MLLAKKNFKFHARVKKCHFGKIETGHEIKKKFWPKAFFWSIMKIAIRFFFRNSPRVRKIQDLCRKKYLHTKRGFSKKDLRELKFLFCFRFLESPWKPGTLNQKSFTSHKVKFQFHTFFKHIFIESIIF